MKYENLIVMVRTFEQISPDSFEDVSKIIDINENTTIGEIMDWYRETFKTQPWDVDLQKRVDKAPDSISLISILQKEVMPCRKNNDVAH